MPRPHIVYFDNSVGYLDVSATITSTALGPITIDGRGQLVAIRGLNTFVQCPLVIDGASEVLIQDMRFFRGPHTGTGVSGDAFRVQNCGTVTIQNCTFGFSTDECLNITGCTTAIVQQCMIYDALRLANHDEGAGVQAHSCGLLISDGNTQTILIENLFANNEIRNPRVVTDSLLGLYGNVFYNCKDGPQLIGVADGMGVYRMTGCDLIGNYAIDGEDVPVNNTNLLRWDYNYNSQNREIPIYVGVNSTVRVQNSAVIEDLSEAVLSGDPEAPLWIWDIQEAPIIQDYTYTPDQALARVLANAGPTGRIQYEQDLCDEVQDRLDSVSRTYRTYLNDDDLIASGWPELVAPA